MKKPAGSILYLLNSSPQIWRAMEELNLRLCKALVSKGVKPMVALSKPVPEEIRSRWESAGVDVRILTYRKRWDFFWSLRRLIRDSSISAVHIRFFRYNSFVAWIVRICGVRQIIFTDAEGGEAEARGLKRILKRLRTRVLTAPTSQLIAISCFVKDRLIESGVPSHKIRTVYNGVDLSRFTPDPRGRERLLSSLGIEADALILVTVSRLWKIKGVHVLLDACHHVRKAGVNFRLLVAGAGPEEAALRRQCHDLQLTDYVTWMGATAEPEVLLRGADIFLLGSSGEAFGNVLVEAMACGVPIVASRSGGVPEIVIDGACGLLAKPADAASFAEMILQLAVDQELRRQLAKNALHRSALFSVESAVIDTLAVYEEAGLLLTI
jgi:glycosyltransferase involved in cell wall biosynthesis